MYRALVETVRLLESATPEERALDIALTHRLKEADGAERVGILEQLSILEATVQTRRDEAELLASGRYEKAAQTVSIHERWFTRMQAVRKALNEIRLDHASFSFIKDDLAITIYAEAFDVAPSAKLLKRLLAKALRADDRPRRLTFGFIANDPSSRYVRITLK